MPDAVLKGGGVAVGLGTHMRAARSRLLTASHHIGPVRQDQVSWLCDLNRTNGSDPTLHGRRNLEGFIRNTLVRLPLLCWTFPVLLISECSDPAFTDWLCTSFSAVEVAIFIRPSSGGSYQPCSCRCNKDCGKRGKQHVYMCDWSVVLATQASTHVRIIHTGTSLAGLSNLK